MAEQETIRASDPNIGFAAVFSHGDPWSNDAWTNKREAGRITWSTKQFSEAPNANAVRWGTTYNFWFEAVGITSDAEAQLGLLKPGAGTASLSTTTACVPQTTCVVKAPR